jgi:hypothetical protein
MNLTKGAFMANMKVGTSQYTPSYEVERKLNSKNDSLKGLSLPANESVEHSMFSRKLGNTVCPEIYAVPVKTVVMSIQGATKARQLTGMGEGGG